MSLDDPSRILPAPGSSAQRSTSAISQIRPARFILPPQLNWRTTRPPDIPFPHLRILYPSPHLDFRARRCPAPRPVAPKSPSARALRLLDPAKVDRGRLPVLRDGRLTPGSHERADEAISNGATRLLDCPPQVQAPRRPLARRRGHTCSRPSTVRPTPLPSPPRAPSAPAGVVNAATRPPFAALNRLNSRPPCREARARR